MEEVGPPFGLAKLPPSVGKIFHLGRGTLMTTSKCVVPENGQLPPLLAWFCYKVGQIILNVTSKCSNFSHKNQTFFIFSFNWNAQIFFGTLAIQKLGVQIGVPRPLVNSSPICPLPLPLSGESWRHPWVSVVTKSGRANPSTHSRSQFYGQTYWV